MDIPILKLDPEARLPDYKKHGDSGFDFYCLQDTLIPAAQTGIMHTGLAFAIPFGYELQIRMRSGASLNTPLIIPNAPATIDSGYRGEIGIIFRNLGSEDFIIKRNERLAQGIIMPVIHADFLMVKELPPSERGVGGYGSTGR